jgi:hypothetical protein
MFSSVRYMAQRYRKRMDACAFEGPHSHTNDGANPRTHPLPQLQAGAAPRGVYKPWARAQNVPSLRQGTARGIPQRHDGAASVLQRDAAPAPKKAGRGRLLEGHRRRGTTGQVGAAPATSGTALHAAESGACRRSEGVLAGQCKSSAVWGGFVITLGFFAIRVLSLSEKRIPRDVLRTCR